MTDKEKIIKGLECCLGSNDCDVEPKEDCPYKGICLCAMALRFDVLALLKERNGCKNCAVAIEDKQPVVRCRDCKHWEPEHDGHCPYNHIFTVPDWFCADGERKSEDD